jgi:hypothetical protein
MTSHNHTSCAFRPLAAKPLPAPIDLNARPSKSPLPIFAPGRSWGRRHWRTGRKPDPCRWIAGGERLPGGLIDFVSTRDLLFAVGFIDSGRPRGGRLSLEFLGHDFLVHSRRKGWLSLIAMPTPERSDPHYTAGGVSGWGRIRRPCRRDFAHQRCKEAIRSPFLNSSMPEK